MIDFRTHRKTSLFKQWTIRITTLDWMGHSRSPLLCHVNLFSAVLIWKKKAKAPPPAPATDSGSFLGAGFNCSCGCGFSFYFSMVDADDLVLRCFSGTKLVTSLHGRAKWMDGYESWSKGSGLFSEDLVHFWTSCDKTKQQLDSACRFIKPMQKDYTPEYWQRIQVAYGLLCADENQAENNYKSFDFFSSFAYIGGRHELRVSSLTTAGGHTDLILELIRKGIVHSAI